MPRQLNLLPLTRRRFLYRLAVLTSVRRLMRSVLVGYAVVTLGGVAAVVITQALLIAASAESLVDLSKEVSTYQTRRGELAKQNITLNHMHDLSTKQVKWSKKLDEFLALIPPGVTITQISGQNVVSELQLSFRGVAINRNTLIVIADRLAKLPWVVDVNAPHTNLLERENPPYQFTIIISNTVEAGQ